MEEIVIVYGPQGAGKKTVADQLALESGGNVVEEWSAGVDLRPGDIAVTNICPPPQVSNARYVEVLHG